MGMYSRIVLAALLILLPIGQVKAQDREKDHTELRSLMKTLTGAINSRKLDLVRPLTVKNGFTMITVDSKKLTSVDELQKYWDGLFTGKNALFAEVALKPESDAPTTFLGDDVGVVHGTSDDRFRFLDGDERTMKTRWTAVVQREDGVWKLSRIHFGANLMDNPVLRASQRFAYWFAGGGLLLGILLGGVTVYLLGRRSV